MLCVIDFRLYIYIYTHIYIHTYIHTYIYIYVPLCVAIVVLRYTVIMTGDEEPSYCSNDRITRCIMTIMIIYDYTHCVVHLLIYDCDYNRIWVSIISV